MILSFNGSHHTQQAPKRVCKGRLRFHQSREAGGQVAQVKINGWWSGDAGGHGRRMRWEGRSDRMSPRDVESFNLPCLASWWVRERTEEKRKDLRRSRKNMKKYKRKGSNDVKQSRWRERKGRQTKNARGSKNRCDALARKRGRKGDKENMNPRKQ